MIKPETMRKFLIFYLFLSSILYASNNLNIQCTKEFDDITNQSPIKDLAPTSIDILIDRNSLKKFAWDSQRLEMHFDFKYDDNFDLKISSSGYSDIKNAVFLEIENNYGYLYRHSQKGVNYKCRKL